MPLTAIRSAARARSTIPRAGSRHCAIVSRNSSDAPTRILSSARGVEARLDRPIGRRRCGQVSRIIKSIENRIGFYSLAFVRFRVCNIK